MSEPTNSRVSTGARDSNEHLGGPHGIDLHNAVRGLTLAADPVADRGGVAAVGSIFGRAVADIARADE
jgi:hypothetical protein